MSLGNGEEGISNTPITVNGKAKMPLTISTTVQGSTVGSTVTSGNKERKWKRKKENSNSGSSWLSTGDVWKASTVSAPMRVEHSSSINCAVISACSHFEVRQKWIPTVALSLTSEWPWAKLTSQRLRILWGSYLQDGCRLTWGLQELNETTQPRDIMQILEPS